MGSEKPTLYRTVMFLYNNDNEKKGMSDMRYPWMDEYLMQKKGVVKDLQKDWNWIRYKIGDKMFVAVCLDGEDKPYYVTLKLEPSEGEFWRAQYADVIPGYYCNKQHWNSIRADGNVPDDVMRDMLDHAYDIVFMSLTKKKQKELTETL